LYSSSSSSSGYTPPEQSNSNNSGTTSTTAPQTKPLWPQAGDLVRYYDLDGGDARGQVLVGRIGYISTKIGASDPQQKWMAEVTELEAMPTEGYYADYGSTKRTFKRTTRNLSDLAPLAGSFVRSESAYKVPMRNGLPLVKAETYELDNYPGPIPKAINQDVVDADAVVYQQLKGQLFRYAALTGLAGTAVADLVKDTEFAIIYFAGFASSLMYLFLLSLKTDTVALGTANAKLVQRLSNLRFLTPLLVFVGVALYNQSLGDANPASGDKLFSWITSQQFAAGAFGFLTYRLPLFVVQIQAAFQTDDDNGEGTGGVTLPGSAGIALQMLTEDTATNFADTAASATADLPTILLVSGPQATGRTDLVNALVATDDRVVRPTQGLVDKVQDRATYERLEQRRQVLTVLDDRYALTTEALIQSAKEAAQNNQVVVVDADVALAQQLAKVGGIRLVGVWVGLESVQEFEDRLQANIANGILSIPEDETPESVIRARIKQIVKEIEYGLSSGIFEFTVLNRNMEDSVQQLKDACRYCFK
jgi:guanylate kinase